MLEAGQWIANMFATFFSMLISYKVGQWVLGLVVLNILVTFLFFWLPSYRDKK